MYNDALEYNDIYLYNDDDLGAPEVGVTGLGVRRWPVDFQSMNLYREDEELIIYGT